MKLEIYLGDYELDIHPLIWKLLPTKRYSQGSYDKKFYWKSWGWLFITFSKNNEETWKTYPNLFKAKF